MAKSTGADVPTKSVINTGPATALPQDAERDVAKAEFAKRLQHAMNDKGWNQSELANAASKFLPKGTLGKDSVSLYIRGLSFPTSARLSALARALGKQPSDLIPTKGVKSAAGAAPVDVRQTEDGMAWLRINQQVKWDQALKILAILKENDA